MTGFRKSWGSAWTWLWSFPKHFGEPINIYFLTTFLILEILNTCRKTRAAVIKEMEPSQSVREPESILAISDILQ